MIQKIRKYTIVFWILILILFGIFIVQNPDLLDPKNISIFIQSLGIWGFIVYAIIFLFRGILLIPSTPLIIVGIILFPDNPHKVFGISMIGIVFSAYIIYQFSEFLGFDEYFSQKVQSERIKEIIEKYGFYAVALWSFFLIFPTDLICYIAGTVRMNIYKFITAVSLGEGLIIGIFIYGGADFLLLLGENFYKYSLSYTIFL